MATVIMECLHEVNQDEQRHRRLAPWTESPRSRKVAASIVPPDQFAREARLTSLQIRLVSEKKLRRIQRKKFRDLQTKIFALWDEFNSGDRSARKLLKACSYLNGPAAS